MKKALGISVAMGVWIVCANTPPAITNVRASQREGTKLVDIYYDAADADGDLLKVRIEISDNDGAKYSVPAFTLTGDIGEGVAPGTGKHIVWDAGTDWDGEYSDQMRVKVFAIDAQGFPGMEWGNEVPPGGFLMGQDGGAEGSGPSRHVNIPWSYWLGKYEVTAQQYCDFLNAALNLGYIKRENTTNVLATATMPFDYACKEEALLCSTGDSKPIRWNVNKFECTSEASKNLPANVTWNGAIAFARFYGYDLPTDAEWEKAARGPVNGGTGAHLKFPWGNEISSSYANITPETAITPVGFYDGNQTPVGPDTVNGYGLYDVIGNAPEWILSGNNDVEDYPQIECLTNAIHNPFAATRSMTLSGGTYGPSIVAVPMDRGIRGVGDQSIFMRRFVGAGSATPFVLASISASYYNTSYTYSSSGGEPIGFRVVRRHDRPFIGAQVLEVEGFNSWQFMSSSYNTAATNVTELGEWVLAGGASVEENGVDDSKCICLVNGNSSNLYLPMTQKRLLAVRLKVKARSVSNSSSVSLYRINSNGSTELHNETSIVDSNLAEVHNITLSARDDDCMKRYYLSANSVICIDDVELITLSE